MCGHNLDRAVVVNVGHDDIGPCAADIFAASVAAVVPRVNIPDRSAGRAIDSDPRSPAQSDMRKLSDCNHAAGGSPWHLEFVTL